jgi:hypothetical protein
MGSDWPAEQGSPEGGQRAGERRLREGAAAADRRDTAADERERIADEREHVADERERVADEREGRLATWEGRMDDRAQADGQTVPGLRRHAYDTLSRAHALLQASQERLNRSEATLHRTDARDEREQRAVEREMFFSAVDKVGNGPEPQEVLEARVRRLRRQFTDVASALAHAQDELADEYERLALKYPQRAAEYGRRVERARRAAAGLRAGPPGDEESG